MKKLVKKLSSFKSVSDKVDYILSSYSCDEIAHFVVELIDENSQKEPIKKISKIRISKEELEEHFSIIQPRIKKG